MMKMNSAIKALSGLFFVALAAAGCSPDSELGGTPVPNLPPSTEVTASPPDLLEGSFIVSFNWTGFDPDGRIRGFQWKLSNDGVDGISVQDTLTYDPVTGAVLHPWNFTASTDTTLLVSAELPNFPRDPEGYNRSYQTHSFFVRAIDENGHVDPSPAYISFNATTLLPTAALTGPTGVAGQQSYVELPSTVTFLYGGSDPDFTVGLPTKVRFLWKRAVLPSGIYAESRIQVAENMAFLVDFGDSTPPWSEWQPFPRQEANRRVSFTNQPKFDDQNRKIYYIFAIQVQDTTGAVSNTRGYGLNVSHVAITESSPILNLSETYLGNKVYSGGAAGQINYDFDDIASGQPLSFSWVASAAHYAGIIETYRYGWDVADPTDPLDPGWAVPAGNSPQHRRAPMREFNGGVHTLTVEVRDNSGQVTRVVYSLTVVQAPPLADQLPLLLVDGVYDKDSNSWRGANGIAYDNDTYRDAFWEAALVGSGGVNNWSGGGGSGRDWIDLERGNGAFNYRTIVNYRALILNARYVTQLGVYQALGTRIQTREEGRRVYADPYNWLAAYQEKIGNLLYCAPQAMRLLQPGSPAYAMPEVFQSREGFPDNLGLQGDYSVGFGRILQPDGQVVWVGETRYPYLTWGISVLDNVSPNTSDIIYGTSELVGGGRKKVCVGVKGLVLNPAFAERHMPGGAPFASTILTDPLIDHRDALQRNYDDLREAWNWGDEEFYDQVIADRPTYWARQTCDNSPVPGGLCLEPMFYSYARFDWIRDQHLRKPAVQNSLVASAAIPDNNPTGVTVTFESRNHGVLDSLRVRVNITHPNVAQLRLELTNPAGAMVVLKEAGTGSGANLVGWYPTDFTPAQPLAPLYGGDVYGNWRLRIIDTVAGGTGSYGSSTSPTALETWFNDTWPVDYYEQTMNNLCGRYALVQGNTSARTNGTLVGLLSWKTVRDKPSQVGDVLWAFDPYRFNHTQMKEAVRWVLGEHFNLPMTP